MSFLRQIQACNQAVQEPFIPWGRDGLIYGWIRPAFAEQLRSFPAVFQVNDAAVELSEQLQGFDQLSDALAGVAVSLADSGHVSPLIDEPYPVTSGGRDAAIGVIDRAAASYFGLRSFGQHLNGYVRDGDDILMWIGRRARDRLIFPGALDNMVAGGLPHGIGLTENLLKECEEEAGIASELAAQAKPVGALSYNRVADRGFRPDVLYCYDLEVPKDFQPINTDGEVEEFLLLPLTQVMDIVAETDEFKLNCNLVVIDFLVRHGHIGPEHPEYLDIVQGLRQPLGMKPTAVMG